MARSAIISPAAPACRTTGSEATTVWETDNDISGAANDPARPMSFREATQDARQVCEAPRPSVAAQQPSQGPVPPSPGAVQPVERDGDREYVGGWFVKAGLGALLRFLPTGGVSKDNARDLCDGLKFPMTSPGRWAQWKAQFAETNSDTRTIQALLAALLAGMVDPANPRQSWSYTEIAAKLRQCENACVAVKEGDFVYLRRLVNGGYINKTEILTANPEAPKRACPLVEGHFYAIKDDSVFAVDAALQPTGAPLYRLGDGVPSYAVQLSRPGVVIDQGIKKVLDDPGHAAVALVEAIGEAPRTVGILRDRLQRRPASMAFERVLADLIPALPLRGLNEVSSAISEGAASDALPTAMLQFPRLEIQLDGTMALESSSVAVPQVALTPAAVAAGIDVAALPAANDPMAPVTLQMTGKPTNGGATKPDPIAVAKQDPVVRQYVEQAEQVIDRITQQVVEEVLSRKLALNKARQRQEELIAQSGVRDVPRAWQRNPSGHAEQAKKYSDAIRVLGWRAVPTLRDRLMQRLANEARPQ